MQGPEDMKKKEYQTQKNRSSEQDLNGHLCKSQLYGLVSLPT